VSLFSSIRLFFFQRTLTTFELALTLLQLPLLEFPNLLARKVTEWP
jgi:hypothetical protein